MPLIAQVQAGDAQTQNGAEFSAPFGGFHEAGMERIRPLHGPQSGHVVVGAGGDEIIGVDHVRRIAESGNIPLRSKGFASGSQLYPQKG